MQIVSIRFGHVSKFEEPDAAPTPELEAKGDRTNFRGTKIWRVRELEPITGVWGRAPNGVRALVRGLGGEAPRS